MAGIQVMEACRQAARHADRRPGRRTGEASEASEASFYRWGCLLRSCNEIMERGCFC